MKKTAYLRKLKAAASSNKLGSISADADRSERLARVDAYFAKTREQFAKQVANANASTKRTQTGVLAGPVARHI